MRCMLFVFPSGEAAAFDEEWRTQAGRYVPPNARALEYGRDRRAGGQQLALTAPPSSTPPPGHRHESPRHRQPHTRPRYDWWEVREQERWVFTASILRPGSVKSSPTWWGDLALILLNSFSFKYDDTLAWLSSTNTHVILVITCICFGVYAGR